MLNITFMGFHSDMKKIYFNKFIVSVYKYLIWPCYGMYFWVQNSKLFLSSKRKVQIVVSLNIYLCLCCIGWFCAVFVPFSHIHSFSQIYNRFISSFKTFFRVMSKPCWHIFCKLLTDFDRWYQQLILVQSWRLLYYYVLRWSVR